MSKEIKALVAINKATNEIVWTEGCDPDGYSSHQLIIPKSLLSDKDREYINAESANPTAAYYLKSNSDNINFGEMISDLLLSMNLDNVRIEMKSIELTSGGVNSILATVK